MSVVLFVEGVCVLLFVGIALFSRNKDATHYAMMVTGLALAYVLFYASASESGLLGALPAFAGSDVAAIWVSSAASYVAFFPMLHEGRKRVAAPAAYLIAAIVAASGVQLYNGLTAPALMRASGALPGHFATPQRRIMTSLADLAISGSFIALVAAAPAVRRSGEVRDKRWFRYRVASFCCYFAGILPLLASDLLASEELRIAGYAISGFNAIAFSFVVTTINYNTAAPAAQTAARLRAGRPEWDGEAEELSGHLEELMNTEAPYRDPLLTVETLARMLNVEPRCLSYHLHAHLSTSFPKYINEWRLKSVCLDLKRRPEENIFNVALDNGFNSKSNFNALFIKAYGKTPSQFRDEAHRRK